MRLSIVGAVGSAVWVIAVACGSSDDAPPPDEPTSGAGGEPSEGGNGGSSRGGDAGRGGNTQGGSSSGDAGDSGAAGSARGGAAGDAGAGSGGTDGPACPDCPADVCLEDGTCVECVSDAHCGGATPGCDTAEHVCVACVTDEHCDGATPGCDTAEHVCVACVTDEHCDGATPGCDTAEHVCVACVTDEHCDGATPACDTAEHVCRTCVPANDACPDGSYCTADFACVPGCKDGPSCASGACLSSHDCDSCIADTECAEDRICATGECMGRCSGEGQACGTGRTCCSERCVDTSRDIRHCGGCDTPSDGHACEAGEFCGTSGCAPAVLALLCQNTRAALMRDDFAADNSAGDVIGNTLAACASPPVVRSVPQDMLDVSNPTTGQPVAGPGELLVVSGGPFGQLVARFLQDQRSAAVRHVAMNERFELRRSADDSIVAGIPTADSNANHDLLLFEVVRDPASGTLVFIVAGFNESGTAAGAWYFQNVMMPSLSTFTKNWYAYEWTDGGANQIPDSSDTFALRGEAP